MSSLTRLSRKLAVRAAVMVPSCSFSRKKGSSLKSEPRKHSKKQRRRRSLKLENASRSTNNNSQHDPFKKLKLRDINIQKFLAPVIEKDLERRIGDQHHVNYRDPEGLLERSMLASMLPDGFHHGDNDNIANEIHDVELKHQIDEKLYESNHNESHTDMHMRNSNIDKNLSIDSNSRIRVRIRRYRKLLLHYLRHKQYADVHSCFDRMIRFSEIDPDELMWFIFMQSQALSGDIEAALKTLSALENIGLITSAPDIYSKMLDTLVKLNKHDAVREIWFRMHENGISLSKESFQAMLKFCSRTGEVERAMFYIHEMRSYNLDLDIQVFVSLFRACAEAPFWIHGYEDILFDAMSIMEGTEIYPNVEIYNNILHAFSRACDASAAELYFLEMKTKGITYDIKSYNILLSAYSREQSVNIRPYANKGRFVHRNWNNKKLETHYRQRNPWKQYLEYFTSLSEKVDILLKKIQINSEECSGSIDDGKNSGLEPFKENIFDDFCLGHKKDVFSYDYMFNHTLSGSILNCFSTHDIAKIESYSSRFDLGHVDILFNLIVSQNDMSTFNCALTLEESPYNVDTCFLWNELKYKEYYVQTEDLKNCRILSWVDNLVDTCNYNTEGELNLDCIEDVEVDFNDRTRSIFSSVSGQSVDQFDSVINKNSVDLEWNKILFVRAAAPNYDINYDYRHQINISKARNFFIELLVDKLPLNIITLNAFLSVYSEAMTFDDAYNVLQFFYFFESKPDDRSLRHLSRMHIRAKDIYGSLKLKLKAELIDQKFDEESYGLLIKSMIQRNMIVDSILMLEQSNDFDHTLLERHIRLLRSRCSKIGIKHPSIAKDPHEWKNSLIESRKVIKDWPSNRKNKALMNGIF